MTPTQLERQPLFKDGVVFKFKDAGVEIRDRDRGFFISVLPEDRQETVQLLRMLQIEGVSSEQIAQACPRIKEQLPELLAEFGDRGLLIKNLTSGVSGRQFYRQLCRFLTRLKRQFPPSPFMQKMAEGTISRNQLIGYALEAYHITHLCPRLLAPALANYESPKTQKLLQEFWVAELHHDRLMENSLASVGVDREQLQTMQPLPMTFAVCSTLGVLANQHPLSFKAALMLFEEDDKKFHELFEQRCQAQLPSEFYRPILLHARINDEEAHENITEILLAEIPYVSPEEQLTVKKNMAVLMESMVLRTHQMLNYYGDPNNKTPRCFDHS